MKALLSILIMFVAIPSWATFHNPQWDILKFCFEHPALCYEQDGELLARDAADGDEWGELPNPDVTDSESEDG